MESYHLCRLQRFLFGSSQQQLVHFVQVYRLSFLIHTHKLKNTNKMIKFFHRDVFHASEEVLLLPKLYCNLNNCLLKVINNDTYKEIPKVFNKVSPYTYTKNKVINYIRHYLGQKDISLKFSESQVKVLCLHANTKSEIH